MHTVEQELEQRIVKRFQKGLTDYQLIDDGDKILIGLSGGKDSLCLLEMLARRSKIFKPRFSVEAVHVIMENIPYQSDLDYLENFSSSLGIKLHVLTTKFEESSKKEKSNCFLCSWNRRKMMFDFAKRNGFNKIALGHHMDDILHTTMMNEYFQGRYGTMPVKLKMQKMPITIIRPLCLEHESDIVQYAANQHYQKQKKCCPFESDTHRADIRRIFNELEALNPETRYSMWNALTRDGKLIE